MGENYYFARVIKTLSKLLLLPIAAMFISIVSCQNNKTQTKKPAKYVTVKPVAKAKIEKSDTTLNCDTTIVNRELSYDALAFDIFKADTGKIKSLFIDPVILKMKKAVDEEGTPYYLHNFTDGVNQILLFHHDDGFYIEYADIKNDKVLLNKKIAIGMPKDSLLRLLKVKGIKCDTITVVDDEWSFESVYIFKNIRLLEIKMGQIVE